MPAPRPTLLYNFANSPDYLDPRLTFVRATTASYVNRNGLIAYVPANAPRWTFDVVSGECLGLIIEPQRTNVALQSQDFSSGSWTKTTCSVTANTATAPDGTTTADTLAAQGASGRVSQICTITSGQNTSFSVFAKSAISNFVQLRITDGTNTVNAWFNLSSGTVGTYTTGGGSCVYALSRIERFPNGWFRCGIGIRTTSNLLYTASIYPASADNTDSANADSIYAWGAQFEFGGALGISTYIPTTVSTVQRDSDSLITSISVATDKWFNLAAGAFYFEWLNLAADNFSGIVPGGIGDTFANTIYISKSSTTINATFGRNSVGLTRSEAASHSYLQRVKAACAWTSANVAFCVDGNSTNLSSSTTSYVPASTQRFGIGYSPWGTTPPSSVSSAHGYGIFRVAAYYSHRLSNSELESLTAA